MTEIPTVGGTPFGLSESDKKDRMESRLILTKGSVVRDQCHVNCMFEIRGNQIL